MKKEEVTTPIPELVEKLNLFQKEALISSPADFEKIYINTICAIVDAIDARSRYTRGHSSRVRHYVEMIGEKLNLPEGDLRCLSIAASLHDIGRMGIDNAIWEKQDKLSKEEYEVVKSYPKESANILSSISFLEGVATIIRHHRENYNGTGYPDHLKGDEIPLEARILSVADAFDAMTSQRPYRERIDPEVAIEELKNKSGTQFDPMIVEIFISTWDKMYGITVQS